MEGLFDGAFGGLSSLVEVGKNGLDAYDNYQKGKTSDALGSLGKMITSNKSEETVTKKSSVLDVTQYLKREQKENNVTSLFLYNEDILKEFYGKRDQNIPYDVMLSLLKKFNPESSASLITFGNDEQKMLNAIVQRVMGFAITEKDTNINNCIVNIVDATKTIDISDFQYFNKHPNGSMFSMRTPLKRKLVLAEQSIKINEDYINKTVPGLLYQRVSQIEEIEHEHKIITSNLVVILETAYLLKDYIIKMESKKNLIDLLDRRIDSLKESVFDEKISQREIDNVRSIYVSRLEAINNTMIGLVNSWRNYCTQMVNMINNNQRAHVSDIAGKFLSVSEQIERQSHSL